MKWMALLVVGVVAASCVPSRPYIRRASPAREIVFEQTSNSAAFVQGEKRIAVLRQEDELIDMVACVPEAAEYAGQLNSWMLTADILRWSSYAAQVVSAALIVGGVVRSRSDMIRAGFIVLPFGIALEFVKDIPIPFAFARAIDAVNAYNDRYPYERSCGPVSRRTRPKPPPDLDEPGAAPRATPAPEPEPEPEPEDEDEPGSRPR